MPALATYESEGLRGTLHFELYATKLRVRVSTAKGDLDTSIPLAVFNPRPIRRDVHSLRCYCGVAILMLGTLAMAVTIHWTRGGQTPIPPLVAGAVLTVIGAVVAYANRQPRRFALFRSDTKVPIVTVWSTAQNPEVHARFLELLIEQIHIARAQPRRETAIGYNESFDV
jgi:hypothetical protein